MSWRRIAGCRRWLLAALLSLPLSGFADSDPYPVDPALIDIGKRYLDTVYRFDFEQQASFYTAESVFEDHTVDIFDQTWLFTGPDEIVGLFRDTRPETPLEVRVDIQDAFIVGDRVHFYVHYYNTGDGTPMGVPGREITVVAKGFTILRIVDGKVLHHLDYIDYPGMFRQAGQQQGEASRER